MITKRPKLISNRGQSVVEFALVFPLFILMFIGIVEFGLFFWTAHIVQNAGREGARHAIILSNLVENDTRVIDRVELVLPETNLITDTTGAITNTVPDCAADGQVTVTINVTYNFVFLNIIGLEHLVINIPTTMRYEGC